MLEMTLVLGKKVRIGKDIVIQVSAISGGKAANDTSEVSLGVHAPRGMLVYGADARNDFQYSILAARKLGQMRMGYRKQISMLQQKLMKLKVLIQSLRLENATLKKASKAKNNSVLNTASTSGLELVQESEIYGDKQ